MSAFTIRATSQHGGNVYIKAKRIVCVHDERGGEYGTFAGSTIVIEIGNSFYTVAVKERASEIYDTLEMMGLWT